MFWFLRACGWAFRSTLAIPSGARSARQHTLTHSHAHTVKKCILCSINCAIHGPTGFYLFVCECQTHMWIFLVCTFVALSAMHMLAAKNIGGYAPSDGDDDSGDDTPQPPPPPPPLSSSSLPPVHILTTHVQTTCAFAFARMSTHAHTHTRDRKARKYSKYSAI